MPKYDDGCQLYPKCLECPYPDCLMDRIPSLLVANRVVEAMELARQGLSKAEIAQRLGVAGRTIYRYLDKVS